MNAMEKYLEEVEEQHANGEISYEEYRELVKAILNDFDND